jgi:hypothetical protein
VTAIIGALSAEAARQDKEVFHARLNLLRKGGREAFAFVKEPQSVRSDLLDADLYGKSSAQSAVEAELEKWRTSCWLPPALSATRASCPEAPLLPSFSMKDLDRALLSFSWNTGLGADQAHPRHFFFVSLAGKRWLRILLTLVEGASRLPTAQSVILFSMLPKPGWGLTAHRLARQPVSHLDGAAVTTGAGVGRVLRPTVLLRYFGKRLLRRGRGPTARGRGCGS